MITYTALRVWAALVGGLLDLIPDVPPLTFMDDLSDGAESLGSDVAPFGAWLPVQTMGTVLAALLALWLVLLGVSAARKVISLMTGGGA